MTEAVLPVHGYLAQSVYCVVLQYTQHSVAWRHHVMLELVYKVYISAAVLLLLLLLLLIQYELMQVAAGWKTSSHVTCVLDDPGACQCLDDEKAIMSFGVAAYWFRSRLGLEYLCRTKLV